MNKGIGVAASATLQEPRLLPQVNTSGSSRCDARASVPNGCSAGNGTGWGAQHGAWHVVGCMAWGMAWGRMHGTVLGLGQSTGHSSERHRAASPTPGGASSHHSGSAGKHSAVKSNTTAGAAGRDVDMPHVHCLGKDFKEKKMFCVCKKGINR